MASEAHAAARFAGPICRQAAIGLTAYRLRLRAVRKSKKAQQVARACALGLRRVCQELVSKGTGAATSG